MKPTDLTIQETTPNSISLSWQPPDNHVTSLVAGYTVFVLDGETGRERRFNLSADEIGVTINQLRPGINYNIKLTAYSENGYGDDSDEVSIMTLPEVGNTSRMEFTFSKLYPFREYGFRVLPYNSNGHGPASDPCRCHTYSDVPSKPPQNITVDTLSSTSIVVRWDSPGPEHENGIVTGYRIRYKPHSDKIGSAATFTVDGGTRMFELN
ncbi:hypothetical protein HELRODRAFT_184662, partial [Helobdella robusta]|uniref:Fibronectin type-III domain-containing protein n=1 Tax=Helobdella robusta TaxID=6412 RepID=T1FLQ1_HELRO